MDAIAKVRKALIALVIAGGGAALTALGAESPGGNLILSAEWWTIAGLALTASGAVFLVPNQLTTAQRARVIAQYQRDQAGPYPYGEPSRGPWRA